MKTSIEWLNRTLKNGVWKQFTHNGNYKWIDLLPRFVSEYNENIDLSMLILTIANKLLNTMYSSVKVVTLPPFKVDDSIRVNKFKLKKVTQIKLDYGV